MSKVKPKLMMAIRFIICKTRCDSSAPIALLTSVFVVDAKAQVATPTTPNILLNI